jgi:hypothetical protein
VIASWLARKADALAVTVVELRNEPTPKRGAPSAAPDHVDSTWAEHTEQAAQEDLDDA